MLKRKAAQLEEARRRVARIVNFVALGRAQDSKALAEALAKDEASVTSLEAEVENLQQASDSGVRFPSRAWIEKRLAAVRELLERRTEASGLVLRRTRTARRKACASRPCPRSPNLTTRPWRPSRLPVPTGCRLTRESGGGARRSAVRGHEV